MVKFLKWLAGPLLTLAAVAIVIGALLITNVLQAPGILGSRTSIVYSQIVNALEREEKISLLALSVQGIARETSEGTIFGLENPFGDRTTAIQYSLTARLGVDGKDVDVTPQGDSSYVVSVPIFTFIGFDDPIFQDPISDDGGLSLLTPEVEPTGIVNGVLSDDNKQVYIDENLEELKEQASQFYEGIIHSIDPDAKVAFAFAS